jgi:hypothetical protein
MAAPYLHLARRGTSVRVKCVQAQEPLNTEPGGPQCKFQGPIRSTSWAGHRRYQGPKPRTWLNQVCKRLLRAQRSLELIPFIVATLHLSLFIRG